MTKDGITNRLIQMTRSGVVTTFGYSPDGELTAIDYPAGTADVSYGYDAAGNVVSMSDGLGVTTYSYNVLNQMASRSRNGRTVSYAYTLNGQVGQVGYWNRGSVQVGYDAAGRLTGLAPWGAAATSYAYRSTGLLASETRPNGVNTAYTYDTASRLTGVNGIGYILDANGNRTQITDWEGVTTYSYDALDRLMQATYPTSTVTYTLDGVGNRLSDGMASFAYDPSDRILNSGYTYDANGNLLADGMATYEYDAANRLIQMTMGGVVTTYGYDGWGNLIQETVNGVTTEFVLDENTAYTRILGEIRSDGGERLYAYGPEGFSAQQAVGSTVEYPLLDGLGSVRQLIDASGTVILTRSYDAYGNVRYSAGAGATRLGYTGELQDAISGLVYLRARHYHPLLGRFLQRDSFGGLSQRPQSLNRYIYVENNPVNLVDPSGHCPFCIIVGAGAAFLLSSSASNAGHSVIEIFRTQILYIAQQRRVNPVILGAIVDHESGSIKRFGGWGDQVSIWLKPNASIGLCQIQPSLAQEIEDAGYMPQLPNDPARIDALMNDLLNIEYAGARLQQLKEEISRWYGKQGAALDGETRNRLMMMAYNQGWDDPNNPADVLDNLKKHGLPNKLEETTYSLAYHGKLPSGDLINSYHISIMWNPERIRWVESVLGVTYDGK
ncbi:MAG: hypothetical protein M9936_20860 [Caldilinea sp.]|nr:hypothetical protein [Caldilinea sp.]